MRKKKVFAAVLVSVMLCAATVFGVTATSVSAASTGETLISFACDGNESYLKTDESSPISDQGIILYDEGSAGATKTIELYKQDAYGVYEFDLDDSAAEAHFNFVGGAFTVAYMADGASQYTDVSITYGADRYQIYTVKLTKEDALSAANRKFKIKLTNETQGDLCLYMMSVTANNHKITSDVKLVNNAVSAGLPYMTESGGNFTYWDGTADKGFIHGSGAASDTVFRFNVDSAAMPTVRLIAPTLDGGVTAAWTYSTDGNSFNSYVAGTQIDTAATPEIFVKISIEAGYRLLIRGLGIEKVVSAGEDLDQVYERADGGEGETPFIILSSGQQIFSTEDGNIGLAGVSINVRLFNTDGNIVYGFDLANTIDEAYFNFVGGDFKVEYSTDGGVTYAELSGASLTAGNTFFVRSYKLTTSDALANSARTFYIRLTNTSAGQICLHSFGVFDGGRVSDGVSYMNNTVTEGLRDVVSASGNVMVYYDNSDVTKGFTYIKAGGEIEYRFNVDSVEMSKPQLALDVTGGTLEWKYSTDGVSYTDGTDSKSVEFAGVDSIYVKVKNGGSADMLLRGITLRNNDVVAQGENSNTSVPVNESESYFLVGSEEEDNYIFGTGGDAKEDFNSHHSGLVKDGHEGGWADSERDNARKLLAGEYIAYDFDMPDSVTSAKLKIHAGGGMKVKVSSDKCTTVQVLQPNGAAGGRGMYIYDLAEANALANGGNTFRVVIEATSETYVFAVLVHEDAELVADGGVSLRTWSSQGLRYLEEANKVHSYYSHSVYPSYFFKEADSYAVFKVKFSDAVTDPVFYVNQCADVKIELSGDGSSYTEIINKLLPGTGEVPYNAVSAAEYLGGNKTIWVKMSNAGNGGFVFDAGFAHTAADSVSGAIGLDNLYDNLYSVSETNGVGTLLRLLADGKKGVEVTGEAVFKFDLVNDAYGVNISVNGLMGTGELLISKDGLNFEMIAALREGNVSALNYSALKNNESNVVYVKLKGTDFMFDGITYTTDGIAEEGDKSKPYDDGDVSFDYDRELPPIDSYGKPSIDAAAEGEYKVVFNKALVIGLSVGGGCLVLLGGGFTAVWFLVIKKKRGVK